MHAQGPGQKNPDVSFDLGSQDTPVKVTLGRQQALDGGVSDNAQVSSRSAAGAVRSIRCTGKPQDPHFRKCIHRCAVTMRRQRAQALLPVADGVPAITEEGLLALMASRALRGQGSGHRALITAK